LQYDFFQPNTDHYSLAATKHLDPAAGAFWMLGAGSVAYMAPSLARSELCGVDVSENPSKPENATRDLNTAS
jgi:hypothetical protein